MHRLSQRTATALEEHLSRVARSTLPEQTFGNGTPLLRYTGGFMSARTLLIIVLILLLIGALPAWPYSTGWGYYPSGGLGLVILILIVLALF